MKFLRLKKAEVLQPNKPKPTTTLPQNMEWSWDPEAADWVAVMKDNNNVTPPLYNPQNQNMVNQNTNYMSTVKSASKKDLSILHKLLEKCWYGSGKGRYSAIGNWSIGLGGYDTGYEVSYKGLPIFSITPNNELKQYLSEESLQRECGLSYDDIERTLKSYKDLGGLKRIQCKKQAGYSNNPDYFGDWFGDGQIDYTKIINPEDDGKVWMLKIWGGSGYILDVYLVKANDYEEAIDITFKWSYENEGKNKIIKDYEYLSKFCKEDYEDEWFYGKGEGKPSDKMNYEDFEMRWFEDFVGDSYNELFAYSENFFIDELPEEYLQKTKLDKKQSSKKVKSSAEALGYTKSKNGYTVKVTDKEKGIDADITIKVNGNDLSFDSNYQFSNDDDTTFEDFTDTAVWYLVDKGLIAFDDNNKWNKVKSEKSMMDLAQNIIYDVVLIHKAKSMDERQEWDGTFAILTLNPEKTDIVDIKYIPQSSLPSYIPNDNEYGLVRTRDAGFDDTDYQLQPLEMIINQRNSDSFAKDDKNDVELGYKKQSSCLAKFLDGPQYSREIKIEAGLIKNGLLKYAGFDFNRGSKYAITEKGLKVLRQASEAEHNEALNEREKLAHLFGFNTDKETTLDTTGKVIKSDDKKWTICEANGEELGQIIASSELDAKVKFGIEHPEYADSQSISAKQVCADENSVETTYVSVKELKSFLRQNGAKEVNFGTFVSDIQPSGLVKKMVAHGTKKIRLTYDEYKLDVYSNGARLIENLAVYDGNWRDKYYKFSNPIGVKQVDSKYEETTEQHLDCPNPSETPTTDVVLENHDGWVNTAKKK